MTLAPVDKLIETFSCNLVLAEPARNPDTISDLLPVLKDLHQACREADLAGEAGQILKMKNIIQGILRDPQTDLERQMEVLGDLTASLSFSISQAGQTNQATPPPLADTPAPDFPLPESGLEDIRSDAPPGDRDTVLRQVGEKLDLFDSLVAGFCPGQPPDLGAMIMILQEMAAISEAFTPRTFHDIIMACLGFVETTPLAELHNTRPMEEALVLLKSILSHLKRDQEFVFDFSDVLALLNSQLSKERAPAHETAADPKPSPVSPPKKPLPETDQGKTAPPPAEPEKISEDDMEILVDFVAEAEENLDTIEVNLIDLEQDPSNTDIINEIFRPFHTIKGVSGFLSLTRINRLAHTTENLLDAARSGELEMDQTATDAILESVDTLKRLIEIVKEGAQTGYKLPDDDVDVDAVRSRLKQIHAALTSGGRQPLGEILVDRKVIDQNSLDTALEAQIQQPDKKIGEILVAQEKVQPDQVASALADQRMPKRKIDSQVKVSTQKLDDLVDYAGELVIAQSMLRQKTAGDAALTQTVSQLGQIVNNMQTIAMSMRMIPIKATFMKMIRLVRDLSRKSGKDVTLTMSGEDTEIDRNVVDALYEPMVHMIRNSVDHGIEPEKHRLKTGKPVQGTIHLSAYHKGGHIIIEIEDDGKGLDRERILEKANSTGLVSGGEQMTDAQVYDLILQPGFSTAREITDVSGRGVGMDVVKDGIEKFRGHLGIDSEKGKGTKFTISLPLTMAIIDGMLVQVDQEKYVIPTISIQKAFKPGEGEYFTVEGKGEMVKDRGRLIPLIRLNDIFNTSRAPKAVRDCLVVVVESKDEKRALLIDELLGKDEFVIKSLGNNLEDVEGLAGGAILSDGRVGLILDIHGIFSIITGG